MQFPTTRATLHSAAVAAADGAIMDVSGCSSVCVQIQGITTATVTWKARNDGANWVTIPGKNKASGVESTTATADGLYDIPIHGCTQFIADITAWTAGTITITAVGIAGGVQAPHTSVAAVVGAIDTELPAAAALADNTSNPTVPGVGAFSMVWDGATWDRLPGNSTAGVTATLAAGTANVGDVDVLTTNTGKTSNPTVTISASPDYSAGDGAGGIISLTTVNSASGRPVKLVSVTAKDDGNQGPALTLLFFKATPAGGTYTDNAALVIDATDLADLVGVVRILSTDWVTISSKKMVAVGGIDQLMAVSATTLFLLVSVDGAWNAASTSDLTLEFGFEQM